MTRTERRVRLAVRLLAALDERRFPQVISVSLGVAGMALGLIFLFLPARLLAMPALAVLLGAASPAIWGSVLLALGAALARASIVNYARSHALSGALSIVLFVFSLLSGLGVFAGAAGITSLLTLTLAWLLLLSACAGIAPKVKALLS